MRKEERIKIIMREINLHNKVLSTDLSNLLRVSDDTVRRDLKELADTGKIVKIHGGAIGKSFVPTFNTQTEVYALEAKQQIALKTIKLLKNSMVVLTEGGTSILEFAKAIPDHLRSTFFTVSPQAAITLSERPNLEVITVGGKLSKNANLHTGAGVINQLAEIKVDLGIIGANGISLQEGITDSDWEIVQVIKAVIRSSLKIAVVSISEKLNTSQRMKICDLNAIDYLITELPPDHPSLTFYKNAGIGLL